QACDYCRAKKVKCDGTRPVCSRCLGLQAPCNYADVSKPARRQRLRQQAGHANASCNSPRTPHHDARAEGNEAQASSQRQTRRLSVQRRSSSSHSQCEDSAFPPEATPSKDPSKSGTSCMKTCDIIYALGCDG
ncbi:hypothetical protein LY78DRAFT_593800, partial [Colletotrichum sublineola]